MISEAEAWPTWMGQAACGRLDPRWWELPPSKAGLLIKQLSADNIAAIGICASCPVKRTCLDDARTQKSWGVIRGGQLFADPGVVWS